MQQDFHPGEVFLSQMVETSTAEETTGKRETWGKLKAHGASFPKANAKINREHSNNEAQVDGRGDPVSTTRQNFQGK